MEKNKFYLEGKLCFMRTPMVIYKMDQIEMNVPEKLDHIGE